MRSRYLNLYFIIPCLFTLLVVIYILATRPKGSPELFINSHFNIYADWFFYCITEIGDGWFIALVAVSLLFVKYADALFLGMQGILVAICSNIFKHLIFTNSPRPPAFFDKSLTLHFVHGSGIFYSGSFPSGHSMASFCMLCTLSFLVKRKRWGLVFFSLALLVAVSRMYLLKHFLFDVTAGATTGIAISILTLEFIYPYFEKAKVLQGSFLRQNSF